jgi:uracil-DNA glycosylase
VSTELRKLALVHRDLDACKACPGMIGPVVHGPAILSKVMLIGQAPGPHEGKFGRPFAWTAGKTLFRWIEEQVGISEEHFRKTVYMAAVARCFPGKAKGGGDRKPDPKEIHACKSFLEREVAILKPKLIIPVGGLAIEQVLERKAPLVDVIGHPLRVRYHGHEADVICLPHPSGASTWFKMEPGKSLTIQALRLLANHPEMRRIAEQAQDTAKH